MADEQANSVPEEILSDPADSVENRRGDSADRDLDARGPAELQKLYDYIVAEHESAIKKLDGMIAEWSANPATKEEEVCEVKTELAQLCKCLEEFKLESEQKSSESEHDVATLKEGENEEAPRDSK